MNYIGSFQIHETFRITGRGIVFVGKVLDGSFRIGDYIEFDFKDEKIKRKITGHDIAMRVQAGKPSVGILIERKDDSEISELRNWNPNLTIGKIYSDS